MVAQSRPRYLVTCIFRLQFGVGSQVLLFVIQKRYPRLFRAPALPPVGRWEKGAPVLPEERARTKPSAPFSGHCVSACHKTLKVLEGTSQPSDCPPFHGRPAAFPLERSSRALLARRRRSAPSWPGRAHCSQSQSCARCVTSSASGGTYAAYSSACCTDAAAVQTMASRWSDIFEREPEREPELGPSHEPGPQPDSWFADKVEDVPPMQATQAPQPEAEF